MRELDKKTKYANALTRSYWVLSNHADYNSDIMASLSAEIQKAKSDIIALMPDGHTRALLGDEITVKQYQGANAKADNTQLIIAVSEGGAIVQTERPIYFEDGVGYDMFGLLDATMQYRLN